VKFVKDSKVYHVDEKSEENLSPEQRACLMAERE
jgi:hypothetical protein